MTDRSFGDHTNRNIYKNPLLSTAVTGLSLEDLTHNAVLLPVSRSQERITLPDSGAQSRTLGNTENVTPSFPSGDANSNITILHQPPSPHPTTLTSTLQNKKTEKQNENLSSTQSKASVKSEDDFDVNEYFARLQGTRYVSAPLNSSLREEKNSNLEEAEQNLEEINLNEPQAETQQSITSDIAQNFSQLPTVLPQVASAVFSSFSNMLSMKSREQTPDINAPSSSGHQVQFETRDVPLMVAETPKEAPPPPLKEPPPVGTGNYRLATTRKKYAQIPGLSSGEASHNPMSVYNPSIQNVPPYFTPVAIEPDIQEATTHLPVLSAPVDMSEVKKQESCNLFNPVEDLSQINKPYIAHNEQYLARSSQSSMEPPNLPSLQPNAPIIPPPPMFSNSQKRDGQTNVGKTILPPSVARRMSANHPIIKQQAVSSIPAYAEHIFVPPPAFENVDTSGGASVTSFNNASPIDPKQSRIAQLSIPLSKQTVFTPLDNLPTSFNASVSVPEIPISSVVTESSVTTSKVPGQPSVTMVIPSGSLPPSPRAALQSTSASVVPSSVSFSSPVDSTELQSNIPVPTMFNPTFQTKENTIAPEPSFYNPAKIASESTSTLPPPTFFKPVQIAEIATSINTSSSSYTLPPISKPVLPSQSSSMPPSYFGPSIPSEPSKETTPDTNLPRNPLQYFGAGTSTEPLKPLPEPPKTSCNVNYRMTKKRPQYYSGPIEGVGAISNNVKPVIQPVESNTFQGGIFVTQQQEPAKQLPISNTDAIAPFDINRSHQNPPCSQREQSNIQTQYETDIQPQYKTAFDLSRATTEHYEPTKEDSKGFGFIGSLKSKLSSLDINKIQSSVTTFFDPDYNDTKKDGNVTQQITSNETQQQQFVGEFPPGQSSFEIFMPSIEPSHQFSQIYDYQMSFQDRQNQQINQQYYQAPNTNNEYQNPVQSVYNLPSYPAFNMPPSQENELYSLTSSVETSNTNIYETLDSAAVSEFTSKDQLLRSTQLGPRDNIQNFQGLSEKALHNEPESTSVLQVKDQSSHAKHLATIKDITQTEHENVSFAFKDTVHFPEASGTPSFFGSYASQIDNVPSNVFDNLQSLQKHVDVDLNLKKEIQKIAQNILATESPEHFFDHKMSNIQEFSHQPFKDNHDQSMYSLEKSDINTVQTTCLEDENVPLLQRGTYLENEMRKMSLSDCQDNLIAGSPFNLNAIVSTYKDFSVDKDVSELSICETCREFDKPEDREVEDLTKQLIENITSPIQLSNPVEVPLTESDIPINDTENFDTNQCAEILHITEETIETIQVQSVAELLEDEDVVGVRNYGWATEQPDYPASNIIPQECEVLKPNALKVLNPNSLGLFGGDSLFADNHIPKNASDEIKAEFKSTHEEPAILTSQMSIPSAPPAEDIKPDESGIDVHSIEQDANEDFPIFEEFVIEPSETDDDKIKCQERRRSSEEIKDIDSFTNRVDRFKQMGEKETDFQKNLNLSTTSPSLPIASYFDTGNYAAETHYRNSLTSPPNVSSINTPNQVSVPPGFEDVYRQKLTGINKDASLYTPDCHTQSRLTYSPTFASAKVISVTTKSLVSSNFSDQETTPAILNPLPDFPSTFCYNVESNQHQKPMVLNSPVSPEVSNHPKDSTREQNNQLDKQEDVDLRQVPNCGTQTNAIFSPKFSTTKTEEPMTTSIQEPMLGSGHLLTNFQSPVGCSKQESKNIQADTPPMFSDTAVVHIPRTHSRTPRKPIESGKMPILANIFGVKDEQHDIHPIPKHQDVDSKKLQLPSRLPAFSNIFDTEKESVDKIEAPSIFQTSDDDVMTLQKPLPDPMNFFSSGSESAAPPSNNEDGSVNRLASYFSSPPKPDSTKSFFELSQGQDHYRQENRILASGDSKSAAQISHFDVSQSQTYTNMEPKSYLENIPAEKYLANYNLMKDLTSVQNIDVNSDQVVRTVNYFTVQYNYEHLPNEFDKGEPESSQNLKIDDENETPNDNKAKAKVKRDELNPNIANADLNTQDDKTVYKIICNCKKCCNMNTGYVKKYDYLHEAVIGDDFKVKKSMDGNTSGKKETDDSSNMPQRYASNDTGSVTVNFGPPSLRNEYDERDATFDEKQITTEYVPVKHHWFYRIDVEGKSIWRGFSVQDSKALEDAYLSPDLNEQTLVPTDGGRYDVNVVGRLRISVYWSEKPSNVMRCSWFYKGTTDARYVPYTEAVAEKLEEEYRHGMTTGVWHRRLSLPNSEVVIMHGPAVMVHFLQSTAADAFGSAVSQPTQLSQLLLFGKRVYRNPPKIRVCHDQPPLIDHLLFLVHGAGEYSNQKEKIQSTMRPRVVRRGHEESEIEDIEPSNIDHLLLLCHGVGSACDIRFRNVEEVVDDFRTTSLQLLQSHYKNSYDAGIVGRVEVLPISWHATLHSGQTGVDRRLARITLDSIPRLRSFTNDTVLDVLFYTSPVFCQTIIDTVCKELNRIYQLFLCRNPGYRGGVSLGGHSLGSVILYDLLCHQRPEIAVPCSPNKTYVVGMAGTGQPVVNYPKLDFQPVSLYALGSPIAIFECIRGVDSLGSDFCLPTCKNFFNIFHPYDPIAYRIEPLINSDMQHVKPFLIPHHKGRKRMHLELKDTMARVGADIKQKLVESIRTTWASMWKTTAPTDRQLEKVVEEEMEKEQLNDAPREECPLEMEPTPEMLGKLNSGRRIDYVLQEAPLEVINEYLFAMSSHVCYWESEDTMLLILREVYDRLGVQPDCTVPPPTMTVQRTRVGKDDETMLLPTDHPSTSRSAT